jgi:hypothetical protein
MSSVGSMDGTELTKLLEGINISRQVLLSSIIHPARMDFEAIALSIEGNNVDVAWPQWDDPGCLPRFQKGGGSLETSNASVELAQGESQKLESTPTTRILGQDSSSREAADLLQASPHHRGFEPHLSLHISDGDFADDAMQELEARELARTPPASSGSNRSQKSLQHFPVWELKERLQDGPQQGMPLGSEADDVALENSTDLPQQLQVEGTGDLGTNSNLDTSDDDGEGSASEEEGRQVAWTAFGGESDEESQQDPVMMMMAQNTRNQNPKSQPLGTSASSKSASSLGNAASHDSTLDHGPNQGHHHQDAATHRHTYVDDDESTLLAQPGSHLVEDQVTAARGQSLVIPNHSDFSTDTVSGAGRRAGGAHGGEVVNSPWWDALLENERTHNNPMNALQQYASPSSEEEKERKRKELAMELEWAQQALESRKEYLRAKRGTNEHDSS